jgi:hypothetical protein
MFSTSQRRELRLKFRFNISAPGVVLPARLPGRNGFAFVVHGGHRAQALAGQLHDLGVLLECPA